MNHDEKAKYLKRYINIDQEIARKLDQIERLKAMTGKITPSYTPKVKGGSTIYHNREADLIDKIVDLKAEIVGDLNDWVDLRVEIDRVIDLVDDVRLRLVLEYRYLDGQHLERVCRKQQTLLTRLTPAKKWRANKEHILKKNGYRHYNRWPFYFVRVLRHYPSISGAYRAKIE